MPSDTLTLALDGEVPLAKFDDAVRGFRRLVDALTREIAKDAAIEWTIAALELGSTTTTVQGESDDPPAVHRVAEAYLNVGRAQEQHAPIPYAPSVRSAASVITKVLDGKVRAVRFETADGDATVYSQEIGQVPRPSLRSAYGAITGRVQTLSSRGGLRFTLYDLLYDKPVSCYLEPGHEETMRGVWGRLATVEGWVSRDVLKGRPVSVRRVSNVQVRPEVEPGSYREARGAVKVGPGAITPEEAIRQLRDA